MTAPIAFAEAREDDLDGTRGEPPVSAGTGMCHICHGSGRAQPDRIATESTPVMRVGVRPGDCPDCGGFGEYEEDRVYGGDHTTETVQCRTCSGSGRRQPDKIAADEGVGGG